MSISNWNPSRLLILRGAEAVRSAALVSLLLLAGCVSGSRLPVTLRVPPGQKEVLHAYAKGVQIYRCQPNPADPDRYVWALKAPEAMLFDVNGSVIGSHYGGPTWESDRDGSKVVAEVLQLSDPSTREAIPLQLLQARPDRGPGLFHGVTYIQCLNTKGGRAPVTGADAAHAGQEIRVRYTADYIFYR
jgi:hypothetical protein